MAYTIPSPLPINCTDCHQPMRVEFQGANRAHDSVIVAAECRCGRIIGEIFGQVLHAHCRGNRPLLRADIGRDTGFEIGEQAAEVIRYAHERIAEMERWIAAATWANGGRKS